MSFLPIFKLSTKVFTPPYIAVNGADKLSREVFISSIPEVCQIHPFLSVNGFICFKNFFIIIFGYICSFFHVVSKIFNIPIPEQPTQQKSEEKIEQTDSGVVVEESFTAAVKNKK